jgi:hypothetical protein
MADASPYGCDYANQFAALQLLFEEDVFGDPAIYPDDCRTWKQFHQTSFPSKVRLGFRGVGTKIKPDM